MRDIPINTRTFSVQYPDTREASVRDAQPSTAPWWMFVWNSGIAMAHKIHELPPSQSILDIGCGLGLTAIVAQSLGHTAYVTDIASECYEYVKMNAEMNGTAHPVWVNSVDDIPLHSLDCVLMSDVLYNKYSVRQTLIDVIHRIKPDGILMIAEPPRLREAAIMHSIDIFKQEYTKDTIILDSILDPSEVKDDYTTTHIYTFKNP